MLRLTLSSALLILLTVGSACYSQVRISIDGNNPGRRLSPLQHGIFFEEINHAGDGGLYGEKLTNRNFAKSLEGWTTVVTGAIKCDANAEPNGDENRVAPRVMRMQVSEANGGSAGVKNEGYWGIGVKKGTTYNCRIDIAGAEGIDSLTVSLFSPSGDILAVRDMKLKPGATGSIYCDLKPKHTEIKAALVIATKKNGTLRLNGVSLMQKSSSTNAPLTLRPDLATLVANMKPSFVRFPGGCYVEGDKLADRFYWKDALGDPLKRPTHYNLWGYQSSDGLGLHEYLQWCEDIKADPLFVVNCGMSHTDIVPMDKMDSYVQDALDAIEYANGDASTTWGAKRAAAGHPSPFNLKLMEIGNENGGPAYNERYALFYDAIKKRYPEMQLVANEPVTSRPMDIVDEHYYSTPQFFMQNAHRYDSYPRTGPKIYVGEYAVTQGCGKGNLIAALGEAFFITGMERNADVVHMSSYAPLFVNENDRKWNPDAIVFDSLHSYGTPSYWAQLMFSANRGDVVLPAKLTVTERREKPVLEHGGVGVGTWSTAAEFTDLKVTKDGQTVWTGASTSFPLKDGHGDWKTDGELRTQSSLETDCTAIGGDSSWTDYTFTLRARKMSGAEGFLILFHARDSNNWYWWNIGGWGNTHHNIERMAGGAKTTIARDVPGFIETGRWYDIRVELAGNNIKCYLDGKLIHNITEEPVLDIGVVATKEEATGDILVKVVNASEEARSTEIDLSGAGSLQSTGTALVLTSSNPNDENTFDYPEKVKPALRKISGVGTHFKYTFPAWSATILRLRTAQ